MNSNRKFSRRLIGNLGALLLLFSDQLIPSMLADSWSVPKETTVMSSSGAFRFRVEPPMFSKASSYMYLYNEDFLTLRAMESCKEQNLTPYGTLEKRAASGEFSVLWRRPLVNKVAPVSMLIAEAGAETFVVTFDDWHFVGVTENTIVIYGITGKLIARHALKSLLSAADVASLSASTSSVSWLRESKLLNGDKELSIVFATPNPHAPVKIDLTSGMIIETVDEKRKSQRSR